MTTPMTLEAFRATGAAVSLAEGVEAIGDSIENYLGATAIWLYAGTTYIQEHPNAEGGFHLVIERSEYQGAREELEARLWFDFAVFEIIERDAWTTAELTTLINDWCAWQEIESASADELLAALCVNPPEDRSYEENDRIAFVEWFIHLWEETQGEEDKASLYGGGIYLPEHDSEIVTRSAPAWAWEVIDETLAMDAKSSAFDADLREKIQRAIDAMIAASEAGE